MEQLTLKNLRLSKKLDENFLARYFNCTIEEIQALEQDSSEISDEMLEKYLAYFRLPYDAIYLGEMLEEEPKFQEGQSQKLLDFFQKFLQSEKSSKFNFYSYFSLIFQLPIIAPLHQIIVLVVQLFYFAIVRVILTGKSKNSRYILSYLIILLEKLGSYSWLKILYICLPFIPILSGLFIFHELPHNFFGYTYSWPIALCATFLMFSFWKKVQLIYQGNLKGFLDLLERYFVFLFRFFLPFFLFLLMVTAINQSFSSPYERTIVLISIGTFLNFFPLGILFILFALPIVDMNYEFPTLTQDLFPFSSFLYGILFLFFQFMCGPLYGRDLEPFYIGIFSIFTCFWLIYFLLRYRLSISKDENLVSRSSLISKKSFYILIFLTFLGFLCLIYLPLINKTRQGAPLSLFYSFGFLIFISVTFSFLFLFLRIRAKKVKNLKKSECK